jgi:hypothetical protein
MAGSGLNEVVLLPLELADCFPDEAQILAVTASRSFTSEPVHVETVLVETALLVPCRLGLVVVATCLTSDRFRISPRSKM